MVYNWALQKEIDQFELFKLGKTDRQFLSFIDLQNMFKEYRNFDNFLITLPSHSMINAISDMIKGYELFFKHKDLNNKPTFKDSTILHQFSSYRPRSELGSFYFINNYVRIEGLRYREMIMTKYYPDFDRSVKIIDPIIFRNNYTKKYHLNFKIKRRTLEDYFIENNILKTEAIGVDVNKENMFACSNGIVIKSPDISRIRNHIQQLDREISQDKIRFKDSSQYSNNFLYKLEKRRQLYQRISDIRRNTAYNGALEIIRCNPEAIILEDLDIKAIMSHNYIASVLQDYPLGVVQDILVNQATKYDIPIIYAPRDFHSSNICSNCGAYKNITNYKYFICPNCGARIDRDINAGINLRNWYYSNIKN